MARMKKLLDVVHDLYQLSDSLKELAQAMDGSEQAAAAGCQAAAAECQAAIPAAEIQKKGELREKAGNTPYIASESENVSKPTQAQKTEQEGKLETTAPPWDEGEQSFASDGGSGASDSTDATPATQTEAIDLATLRAKVAVYSTPENRPRIRNVLASFGAAKLTELREEQYAAVLKEVESVCRT